MVSAGEVTGHGNVESGHGVVKGINSGRFNNAHPRTKRSHRRLTKCFAKELDGAFLRPEVGASDTEKRGFSAAIGTKNRGDLFGSNRPGDVREDGARVVAFAAREVDAVDGEDCGVSRDCLVGWSVCIKAAFTGCRVPSEAMAARMRAFTSARIRVHVQILLRHLFCLLGIETSRRRFCLRSSTGPSMGSGAPYQFAKRFGVSKGAVRPDWIEDDWRNLRNVDCVVVVHIARNAEGEISRAMKEIAKARILMESGDTDPPRQKQKPNGQRAKISARDKRSRG